MKAKALYFLIIILNLRLIFTIIETSDLQTYKDELNKQLSMLDSGQITYDSIFYNKEIYKNCLTYYLNLLKNHEAKNEFFEYTKNMCSFEDLYTTFLNLRSLIEKNNVHPSFLKHNDAKNIYFHIKMDINEAIDNTNLLITKFQWLLGTYSQCFKSKNNDLGEKRILKTITSINTIICTDLSIDAPNEFKESFFCSVNSQWAMINNDFSNYGHYLGLLKKIEDPYDKNYPFVGALANYLEIFLFLQKTIVTHDVLYNTLSFNLEEEFILRRKWTILKKFFYFHLNYYKGPFLEYFKNKLFDKKDNFCDTDEYNSIDNICKIFNTIYSFEKNEWKLPCDYKFFKNKKDEELTFEYRCKLYLYVKDGYSSIKNYYIFLIRNEFMTKNNFNQEYIQLWTILFWFKNIYTHFYHSKYGNIYCYKKRILKKLFLLYEFKLLSFEDQCIKFFTNYTQTYIKCFNSKALNLTTIQPLDIMPIIAELIVKTGLRSIKYLMTDELKYFKTTFYETITNLINQFELFQKNLNDILDPDFDVIKKSCDEIHALLISEIDNQEAILELDNEFNLIDQSIDHLYDKLNWYTVWKNNNYITQSFIYQLASIKKDDQLSLTQKQQNFCEEYLQKKLLTYTFEN